MGLSYGIKNCREAMVYMSTADNIDDRLLRAIGELSPLEKEDVTDDEKFAEITAIQERYYKADKEDLKELEAIGHSLAWLCAEVIEENAKKDK